MPDFPPFRYHPDPVATGQVVESVDACIACERARSFIYVGPVYAVDELVDSLCPWCIADGAAAAQFDASFTDVGWGVPNDVPRDVVDEIAHRTPSFSSWQQDHWLYHCGDGCAFLGAIGAPELRELEPGATEAVVESVREYGWGEAEVNEFVRSLDREGQPTAYLFRCLHCRRHLAFCDFT